MNVLVLMPRQRRLEYAFFGEDERTPLLESRLNSLPSDGEAMMDTLAKVRADCTLFGAGSPDLVVVRSAYGGRVFTGATRVDAPMLLRLGNLAAEAPMHVPPAHLLAEASLQAFAGAIVVMAFETSFLVGLPARERRYAIADDRVRRFGYHGLYHQTASEECHGRRTGGQTRTLSLCLEPQPEMAAIIGHRPVMVTSGATPLEGLPGETSCGELDPTIVLTMARNLGWGPEQINDVLTKRSGLRGLLGRPSHLGELLDSSAWPAQGGALPRAADGTPGAARNILAYRILQAAGAGLAAMGGLDRIVITGRYAQNGRGLGRWLDERLRSAATDAQKPPVILCTTPLPRILADQGVAAACKDHGPSQSAGAFARGLNRTQSRN